MAGNKYRQWYAMRSRLRAAGRWSSDQDAQPSRQTSLSEHGFTGGPSAAKRPRIEEGDPATPDSLPALETAEGKKLNVFLLVLDGVE